MSPSAWKANHNLAATVVVATPDKVPLILPFSAIIITPLTKSIQDLEPDRASLLSNEVLIFSNGRITYYFG